MVKSLPRIVYHEVRCPDCNRLLHDFEEDHGLLVDSCKFDPLAVRYTCHKCNASVYAASVGAADGLAARIVAGLRYMLLQNN